MCSSLFKFHHAFISQALKKKSCRGVNCFFVWHSIFKNPPNIKFWSLSFPAPFFVVEIIGLGSQRSLVLETVGMYYQSERRLINTGLWSCSAGACFHEPSTKWRGHRISQSFYQLKIPHPHISNSSVTTLLLLWSTQILSRFKFTHSMIFVDRSFEETQWYSVMWCFGLSDDWDLPLWSYNQNLKRVVCCRKAEVWASQDAGDAEEPAAAGITSKPYSNALGSWLTATAPYFRPSRLRLLRPTRLV